MVRKHEHTAVRQAQIIDAASKLILEHGSEHVTVRRIAQKVGISEAAVYRHFKSKSDILSLLADHIEESLLADIVLPSAEGCDPTRTLDNVLRSHISTIEQRRGTSFQVIAEIISWGDKELNWKASRIIDRYIGRLRELLSYGVQKGEVRDDIDLEAAATLLFGMIQGLVNKWALTDYGFDLEQKFSSLWLVYREAITKH
jgi:AcrR family transcriptional regulator